MIAVHSNSFKTVRGRTLLCAIFDEIAMWRDVDSALPDIETYRAVFYPALMTTNGMLIGISSPYRKTGLLFTKHRDYFSVDDPRVLVVQGASRQFNPTLDEEMIATASQADPEAAIAVGRASFALISRDTLDDDTIESVNL